jgi:hypothetical protein
MAMKKRMTLEQAQALVAVTQKGLKQFGVQYSPAHSKLELIEAMHVLAEHSNADGPSKEEHTKLARQLAACTSREKGLRNRIAGINNEDDAAELKANVANEGETVS